MTTTTTTVDAAIAYLVSALPANMPANSEVVDGVPTEYTSALMVAVTGWELDQAPATLGGPIRFQVEETYTVTLAVRAFVPDSMQAARSAYISLYNAIQATVRADPTLGGAIRVSWVERDKPTQGPTDIGGYAVEGEITIRCEARIS